MTVEFENLETYHIYVRKRQYKDKPEYNLASNVCRGPMKRRNRELYVEIAIDRRTGEVTISKQTHDN